MKILGLDIETAPNTAFVWNIWKENIPLARIIETSRVMCFAARWYSDPEDESPIEFFSEQGGKRKHKAMVDQAWHFLDEADVVVHYNGKSFDVPTLNREFLVQGYAPPAPFKQVDLYRTVRAKFKFTSNKMDHILDELGLAQKESTTFELWRDCMNGVAEAWALMERYNRGDVDRTEALYRWLLPWISNHPNHALYQDTVERPTCPRCGSTHIQYRGKLHTQVLSYRRFQCQDCGGWSQARYTCSPKADRKNVLKSI
jgi:hypothetical protein